jgi:hypothetical protein
VVRLVTVAQALEDLDRCSLLGGSTMIGLEAALEGAVLLDVLAVLVEVVAPMHCISPRRAPA